MKEIYTEYGGGERGNELNIEDKGRECTKQKGRNYTKTMNCGIKRERERERERKKRPDTGR